MKLWHDDVRPAPEGWLWARTNDAAKAMLGSGEVEEVSLDHDLGYDGPPPGQGAGREAFFIAGTGEETGYDLVKWMCETGNVPPKVTVHSWNPDGAKRMEALLRENGHACAVAPFQMPSRNIDMWRRT